MDKMKNAPKVLKESKNKIRVEFEDKTPLLVRLRKKVFSMYFLTNVVWYVFRLILLIGVSYIILFPFFSKIAGSFMSPSDLVDPMVCIIPKSPTLEIYKAVFLENHYIKAFFNTFLLSLSAAFLQTFVCMLIGYGLAKFRFKGNGLIMIFVILTMIIPHETIKLSMMMHFRYFDIGGVQGLGIPGLIQLVTGIFQGSIAKGETFNLMNTFAPLIILSVFGLGFKNGLYIFMMRQFYTGVPDELEESAYVDGANTFRTFFQIIIPLSIPMMITIFLFSFCWQWTDDFYTKLFFTNGKTLLMPDIIATPESLKAAAGYAAQKLYYNVIDNTCGIMIIMPLVILYLFCQKYLVQGIERSGLVG